MCGHFFYCLQASYHLQITLLTFFPRLLKSLKLAWYLEDVELDALRTSSSHSVQCSSKISNYKISCSQDEGI